MKTIYILRHAKAEHNSKIDDHERPLSQEGVDSCGKVASYLQAQPVKPDVVLCSPSSRTRGTFEAIAAPCLAAAQAFFIPALYLASAGEILNEINRIGEEFSSALIIGHNPGLHHMAVLLAAKGDKAMLSSLRASFPTAGLAIVECNARWQDIEAGSGHLTGFLTA